MLSVTALNQAVLSRALGCERLAPAERRLNMASAHGPHGHRFPWLRLGHYHHLGDVWLLLVAALILSALVAVAFGDARLMSALLWMVCVYTIIWLLMEWMYRLKHPKR